MRKALIIVVAIGLAACDKGGDGKAAAASGNPSTNSAPASGPTTTLTKKQLDEAESLTDPDKVDESLAAVTGKLGKPQKTEGDTSIWYAADSGNCYRLVISKTKGIESGTTDKESCGLK